MQADYNQVRHFIAALTGDSSTSICWQQFYDPKDGTKRPELAREFHGSFDQVAQWLEAAQRDHCGIYATINETDGRGRRAYNMTRVRALFADYDGIAEPDWPIPPHFTTARDATHGHAFWLVDGVSLDDYPKLQKLIAVRHGTDHQTIDVARVCRVPGFIHMKQLAEPAMYHMTSDLSQVLPRYTPQDIYNAFRLTPDQGREYTAWLEGQTPIVADDVALTDEPQYIAKFTHYLQHTAEPAIDGDLSHSSTLRVMQAASFGRDYGLTYETAAELMRQHFDPRCVPSWAETGEISQFNELVARGYRYANNSPGCRTAAGAFSIAGAVPEPLEGWEANAASKQPAPAPEASVSVNFTNSAGSFITASITRKTPAADMADAFLATAYDNDRLLYGNETFYRFTGSIWEVVITDTLEAEVYAFYRFLALPGSNVRNVVECLRMETNVNQLEPGTWLDDPSRPGENVIVFQNGYIDLDQGAQLVPHDRNYFSLNKLTYDYDPTAGAPEWGKFLQSVWPGNQDMWRQLQQWAGYLLVNDAGFQKMALLLGKPRSGKGTITSVIEGLIGSHNVSGPSLDHLDKDAVIHSIHDKRVAMVPDAHSVSPSRRNAVLSQLKAMTGGDSITWDVKFKSARTQSIKTKFMLSANDMPRFEDPSGAFAARLLVFPFTESFAGREDHGLKARLLAEVPGICNWAIAGLRDLRAQGGFTLALSGNEVLEDIRDEMFPLSEFCEDMLEPAPEALLSSDRVHEIYRMWCTRNGIRSAGSKQWFIKTLLASPMNVTAARWSENNKRVRGCKGVQLSQEAIEMLTPSNVVSMMR